MRFHPDITEIVDMTTTADQMKIFDTLNAASPSVTVIDVRAGLLSPALASLRDIGFLDAAKSGQITFAVFHILGPSIASLDEIAQTANFMQGAEYFLVKNFINDTQFFQWDQATYNSYFHRIKDATEPTIPKSTKLADEQVEGLGRCSSQFVANKGVDDEAATIVVPRGDVRIGRPMSGAIDRIKLTDLVGSGKTAKRVRREKSASCRYSAGSGAESPPTADCTARRSTTRLRRWFGKMLIAPPSTEIRLLKHGTVAAFYINPAVAAGNPAGVTETADAIHVRNEPPTTA